MTMKKISLINFPEEVDDEKRTGQERLINKTFVKSIIDHNSI